MMDDPLKHTPMCELDRDNRLITLLDSANAGVNWITYRRTQHTEMQPWSPDIDMASVSISLADRDNGSPKLGDMIARNPDNPADQWLVAEKYFLKHFAPIE